MRAAPMEWLLTVLLIQLNKLHARLKLAVSVEMLESPVPSLRYTEYFRIMQCLASAHEFLCIVYVQLFNMLS